MCVCVCVVCAQFPGLLASLSAEDQALLGKFFQSNKINVR